MKLPTGAPRTVLVILLGVALLELGVTSKFSAIWQLAFTGHMSGGDTPSSGTPTPSPAAGGSSGGNFKR